VNARGNFADKLAERVLTTNSRVCVGCDPDPEHSPPPFHGTDAVAATARFGFGSDFPREMLVTGTLERHDGKTTMTLRHAGTGSLTNAYRDGIAQG
jgi:hypothetical protein